MKAKRIISAIMSAMMLATGFTVSAGSVSAVNEQPIEIAAEEQQTESVVTNATESVQKNLLSVPNVTAAQDVKLSLRLSRLRKLPHSRLLRCLP